MKEKFIYLDMDGTIADLYGTENWLPKLIARDPSPYEYAKPLLNMNVLARALNKLQAKGYKLGIISWLSKTSTPEYDEKVTTAKKKWLKRHLRSVKWDKVDIVPYGTPKEVGRTGILFDDEEKNRANWGEGAYDVHNILEVLKSL